MKIVYALLVGIDAYPPPVRPLRGCGNDITLVAEHLAARVEADPRILRDGQATREAVITGLREHLGRAGPGDTALFWFCGHGSRVPMPFGLTETLVCVDSRAGGYDLLDKEIAGLLGAIAGRGAHVVAVLDCCHADGAARDDAGIRSVPPGAPPPVEVLIPDPLRGADPYVTLAACHVNQLARESQLDGRYHGVFSHALLRQLNRPGGYPTYRDLMTGARWEVENVIRRQQPVLRPSTDPIVDRPFLGGAVGSAVSAVVLRNVRRRWEVNVGACHGVLPGTTFAVAGSDPVREVTLRQVLTERSIVDDPAWPADPALQYPLADLEQVARWQRIRKLTNPASGLAVRLEILPTADHLYYQWDGDAWRPPEVIIRIHNDSDRELYCALLDLTDRYQIHADLLPGDWVAAGQSLVVDDGEPIELCLPPGRAVRPGAEARDWLLLVASERPFDVGPFQLEPRRGAVPAGDWVTRVLPIVTRVPTVQSG